MALRGNPRKLLTRRLRLQTESAAESQPAPAGRHGGSFRLDCNAGGIRCGRRPGETRRANVSRPASADCASSWLQELLTLLLQLQHVLRRTQIDPFVERERGQQAARTSINCTSSTSQWPAPTLR